MANSKRNSIHCPNCQAIHQPLDVCLVAVALGVVASRMDRDLTPEEIERVYSTLEVDAWWDLYIGPALDEVQRIVEAS